MHAYEAHLRAEGKEPTHAFMKEMLAGIAAAEVDRLIETKGLDYIDRHQAEQMAQQQAYYLAQQRYGDNGNGWAYAQNQQDCYTGLYNYNGRGVPWGMQGCPSYGRGFGRGFGQGGRFERRHLGREFEGRQLGGGFGGRQLGGGFGGRQLGGGLGGLLFGGGRE